ncbi:MAG: hypothetical protein ACXQTA_03170 [Candidatus Syntropharchaeales archaeon]
MSQFDDIVDFYIGMNELLKSGGVSLGTPLEEIVLRSCEDCSAYIDNRRDAKRSGYDLWKNTKNGSIASFNSTLPTKSKNLDEIDIINGKNLVSRVASSIDRDLSLESNYNTYNNNTYNRRCFYLIRTHANRSDKVKISIVDGSFFETVPKEHLIHQLFLNVLRAHLEQKEVELPPDTLKQIEKALSHVTDQTIMAGSQAIEKASIRPRLRIMADLMSTGDIG